MEHDHGKANGDHQEMMRKEHMRNLWAFCGTIALGTWLLSSPATFGYSRSTMVWSDVISGALLMVFGFVSLSARRFWARWVTCAAGIWLLFAPLVFWAPSATAYATDNLVGALVIAFSIVVPGMPDMSMEAMTGPGPDVPPG
jgi:hypothetical protein